MLRHTLTFVIAALLAAVVGAQGPKGPTPAQRGELFKKDRTVIENLVDQTVASARTPNDYVKQAKSYYPVLYNFNLQIAKAGQLHDAARVEELTHHLETLLDKGLAPTLVKARVQVENGSGNEEYVQVKADLLDQVNALLGILAESPATRAFLEDARRKLDEINGPKKK
jgi:hypothetical protein